MATNVREILEEGAFFNMGIRKYLDKGIRTNTKKYHDIYNFCRYYIKVMKKKKKAPKRRGTTPEKEATEFTAFQDITDQSQLPDQALSHSTAQFENEGGPQENQHAVSFPEQYGGEEATFQEGHMSPDVETQNQPAVKKED